MITRREAIRLGLAAAGSAAAVYAGAGSRSAAAAADAFALPPLPYAVDALEPHIDAQTMTIHHGKHHQGYVNNLNAAVAANAALAGRTVEELVRGLNRLPEDVRGAVRNHGGGHLNHSLFWKTMKKGGGGEPKGDLAKAIDKAFGGFADFKQQFSTAAGKVFGSGWAWLTIDADKTLKIESTPNQDNPLTQGRTALLGIDVWEHAYYLKYQNRRPDYVAAFFNVVDWDFVAERLASAR